VCLTEARLNILKQGNRDTSAGYHKNCADRDECGCVKTREQNPVGKSSTGKSYRLGMGIHIDNKKAKKRVQDDRGGSEVRECGKPLEVILC
jgi:hypothetical protein